MKALHVMWCRANEGGVRHRRARCGETAKAIGAGADAWQLQLRLRHFVAFYAVP